MVQQKQSVSLVLASSSPYRRQLLQRLGLDFQSCSPAINESRKEGETAEDFVARLALEKARCMANEYPGAVIIGSDQVAILADEILTKPEDHYRAVAQLEKLSGREVCFLTGVCVLNAKSGREQSGVVSCYVSFRMLEGEEIERYLRAEKPYDCAGSFKSEGLGISLLRSMRCDDPTSLIGLPLIRLAGMLRKEGISVP